MQLTGPTSDETVLAELGRRLARYRLDRNLSQAELARSAGVSKRTVERLESGASSQLGNFPLILDGGPALDDAVSTIIDLTQKPLRVLRPGPISAEALAAVLERPVLAE